MEELDTICPLPADWTIRKNIIKVIGVGGGGSNAVTQMFKEGIKDVDFMICNTDSQALSSSPVPEKLQLGTILTKGLGAGCNPEQGRNAAIESIDAIKDRLSGETQMVFITAGMGGGTGTGAAPIIASVAQELGLLTIGVVTQPFRDEGIESIKRAYDGILELSQHVDSLLIIDNEKLYDIFANLSLLDAFPRLNGVLKTAVKGIAEIITGEGYINVDFADVRMVMRKSGMALMGIGEAVGENRSTEAVKKALSSPLLENYDLKTAKSVLVNITSSTDLEQNLKMEELQKIMDYIIEYTGSATNFKRGVVFDKNIEKDKVRVTVVATGFKMHITPPPTIPITNNEDVEILDTTEEESTGGIQLSIDDDTSPSDISNLIHKKDNEIIPIYKEDISISDYENEPAIVRRNRLIQEKKEITNKEID